MHGAGWTRQLCSRWTPTSVHYPDRFLTDAAYCCLLLPRGPPAPGPDRVDYPNNRGGAWQWTTNASSQQ